MTKICFCCRKSLGFLSGEHVLFHQVLCDKCYNVFGVHVNKMRALNEEDSLEKAYQDAVSVIKSTFVYSSDALLNDLNLLYQNRLHEIEKLKKAKAQRIELEEKKKLEDKAQEERQAYIQDHYTELSNNFLMTTGYDFQGYIIEEYLGVISEGVVQGTGWLSELSADFNDLFGTESNTFAEKMKMCREAALERIKRSAIQKNSNALIAIDFDTMTFRNNMIGIMATGTAVRIKKNSSM